MPTTLALEGSGATIQFLGCGFSSDLLGLVLSDKAREAIETTHLGTAVAKTYRPGETQDLGTIEAVFDHAPDAVNLVGRPPEQIVIRYPDTELMQYDPIVLWGFAVQQGGEKMWPDNRMVTGVTIKLSINIDEVIQIIPPTPPPPPEAITILAASPISNWLIDPLYSYTVRQPVVTHKITSFSSQNL